MNDGAVDKKEVMSPSKKSAGDILIKLGVNDPVIKKEHVRLRPKNRCKALDKIG